MSPYVERGREISTVLLVYDYTFVCNVDVAAEDEEQVVHHLGQVGGVLHERPEQGYLHTPDQVSSILSL